MHRTATLIGALALALAGCSTVPEQGGAAQGALPPPPPSDLAPMTDAVKSLYGEWRAVSGPGVSKKDVLTIWSPMFSWGTGCEMTQGQLRDQGDGRYTLDDFTRLSPRCQPQERLAPFDGSEVRIALVDDQTLRVERGGKVWTFAKVDVAGTVASEDFVRGEWLLADRRGRPYRGDELTRVTFGPEYVVDAPNCELATNSWFPDRDWQIQIGGSYARMSEPCRSRTLGDRLAKQGTATVFIAEPVETRITVRIGNTRATLVPAARFPELAADAEAIAPDPWAQRLAEAGRAGFDGPPLCDYALRAIGLGNEGLPVGDNPIDERRLAFAGLNAFGYGRAHDAGLLPPLAEPPANLEQHLAGAPIVVRARFEGIRPVDRGDGLSLDYHYRVIEGWRGDRAPGDLVIVRMPAPTHQSRSPVITPEIGAEVLLLASRTGYLAGRLIDGKPPSTDTRVVQMTLPLMRVVDRKLVEAIEGANVLGAASFADTSLDEARTLARSVDERMLAFGQWRPFSLQRQPDIRRYFVTRIGDRVLKDPARLWLVYDHSTNFGKPNGYGGMVAYFDGCTPVFYQRENGRLSVFANAVACPGTFADGTQMTERAVGEGAQWIEENQFPHVVCILGGSCDADQPNIVPLPSGEVELREMLR